MRHRATQTGISTMTTTQNGNTIITGTASDENEMILAIVKAGLLDIEEIQKRIDGSVGSGNPFNFKLNVCNSDEYTVSPSRANVKTKDTDMKRAYNPESCDEPSKEYISLNQSSQ